MPSSILFSRWKIPHPKSFFIEDSVKVSVIHIQPSHQMGLSLQHNSNLSTIFHVPSFSFIYGGSSPFSSDRLIDKKLFHDKMFNAHLIHKSNEIIYSHKSSRLTLLTKVPLTVGEGIISFTISRSHNPLQLTFSMRETSVDGNKCQFWVGLNSLSGEFGSLLKLFGISMEGFTRFRADSPFHSFGFLTSVQ
jgi:hypothetical protein